MSFLSNSTLSAMGKGGRGVQGEIGVTYRKPEIALAERDI